MQSKLHQSVVGEQRISTEILDFSQSLAADALKQETYDVLVASDLSVFALKPELAIENMLKVLKIGGKFCILAADATLDKIRPVLDATQMETMILRDLDLADAQHSSMLIATKHDARQPQEVHTGPETKQITLVQVADPNEVAQAVASQLAVTLEQQGYETSLFAWGSDMSLLTGKTCISLLEFQKPLLRDLTLQDFDSVKRLIHDCASLLWVTGFDDPSAAMIDGLARVVRNETPGLSLRTVHADESSLSSTMRLAELIGKAFVSVPEEDEIQLKHGLLHVSRIEEDTALNQQVHGLLPGAPKTMSSVALRQAPQPLKLCVQTPGMLDSICMEPDSAAEIELQPDYIEIQVKAAALK